MSVVEIAGSLDDWATERLETEITLVAAHLAAGECRWLQLVAEFDRREAWSSWGCASAAHWLNFRCGVDMGTARQRVRVARRLAELPFVTAAFSAGELSYSKVRAITRVATVATEELLVDLARCMTASQVERTVRCYRQVDKPADDDAESAGRADSYGDRFLSTCWNDDGSLSIRAKLPPVEGEMVMAALRRASDVLYRDRHGRDAAGSGSDNGPAEPSNRHHGRSTGDGDGPAEPSNHHYDPDSGDDRRDPEHTSPVDAPTHQLDDGWGDDPGGSSEADVVVEAPSPADGWGARQADALVAIAETVVADGLRPGSGPNRHRVVIHTTIAANHAGTDDTEIDNGGTDNPRPAYVDNGPLLPCETVRRLMCDASLTFVLEDQDGAVINVSRYAPSIPAALARAVKLRDGCCVFPGCTRQAFVDLHHLVHRADGGENTLRNCAVLCRVHHRMVHEGGYAMATSAPGRFEFYRPDGTLIGHETLTVAPGDRGLRELNAERGVHPTEDSPVPDWDGTRPDYPHIIDILLDAEGHLRDRRSSDN